MDAKAHGKAGSKKKRTRWLGVMELAERLGCHPFSIPRFVKKKPGFPQPTKLFGKNLWDEAEVDAYIERLLAEKAQEKEQAKEQAEAKDA